MKKVIVIAVGVLVLIFILGGAAFWFMMQQSLYEPGMVHGGTPRRLQSRHLRRAWPAAEPVHPSPSESQRQLGDVAAPDWHTQMIQRPNQMRVSA